MCAFSVTLTTTAHSPRQLTVVCDRLPQGDRGGPTSITSAALPQKSVDVLHRHQLLQHSWHTVAAAIDEVTAHLPPPEDPWACPLCSTQSWPCSRFDNAAHQVMNAGLRLGEFVPDDLHPRLWPTPKPPSRSPAQPAPQADTWFDEETRDG